MAQIITDIQKINEVLSRGVNEVIDSEHLRKRMLSGERLRIKLGIDPTSPNLHIGRAVALLKLRDFQELGHQVVFIIGDFTGVIGDTSDKESERPMLDEATIKRNMKTYVEQAGKILDMSAVEVKRNSKWLGKLTYKDVAEHANVFSLAEFSARENIAKRLAEQKRVSLREILYPLMQGYDSIAIDADVEIGGTDQRFNLLAGRELQRYYKKEPQDILMLNLIEGIDGRKMSSSWGNTINLTDEPNDMFGKVMTVHDELMLKYFVHCTRVSLNDIRQYESRLAQGENPRDIKLDLAQEITRIYWGEKEARQAREYFVTAFEKKEIPTNIPEIVARLGQTFFDALIESEVFSSKSELTRVFEQGGVHMLEPQEKTLHRSDEAIESVVKVGKTMFFTIKIR